MWRVGTTARLSLTLVAALMLINVTPARAYMDEPMYEMQPAMDSTTGVATIYEVAPNSDTQFLDTIVRAGAYNIMLPGFANERILQPIPTAASKGSVYFSIGRYFDSATAARMESQKGEAVRQHLSSEPIRFELNLVEHLLADWGWEKGAKHTILRTRPSAQRTPVSENVFLRKLSALSFFKIGYVGQVGMLEIFSEKKSIEQIRDDLEKRQGLSGASIYSTKVGGYVVYSEYFKAPRHLTQHKFVVAGNGKAPGVSISGGQIGIVVQNYMPR